MLLHYVDEHGLHPNELLLRGEGGCDGFDVFVLCCYSFSVCLCHALHGGFFGGAGLPAVVRRLHVGAQLCERDGGVEHGGVNIAVRFPLVGVLCFLRVRQRFLQYASEFPLLRVLGGLGVYGVCWLAFALFGGAADLFGEVDAQLVAETAEA